MRGEVSLHLLLTIFLAFGMLLFGGLAIKVYRDNTFIVSHQKQLSDKAAADAATKQKAADDLANTKANQLPFRTYTADPRDGSFQLQIPKSWSLYAGHNFNTSQLIQLDLISDPHIVDSRVDGGINTHAFRLQLQNRSVQDTNKSYAALIKKKVLKSRGTQVSGIPATLYEGQIDDQRHNGIAITFPVRDKSMIITTDTRNFLEEFNKIVSTAKIVP